MNMDYCKYENTAQDMSQLMEELRNRLENPGTVEVSEIEEWEDGDEWEDGEDEEDEENEEKEMSTCEMIGLRNILSFAVDIVETAGGVDELREAISEMPI